jgi:hypothetical protein
MFQGSQICMVSAFQPNSLPDPKQRSAKPKSLESTALCVSEEFQQAHCRTETRSGEVQWQVDNILIPHRDSRSSDQNTGIRGKPQPKGYGSRFAGVFKHCH